MIRTTARGHWVDMLLLPRAAAPAAPATPQSAEGRARDVAPIPFRGDDVQLVQALCAGHPGAAAAFYDQHAKHVLHTLRSILGADEDVPDLLQEVFLRGFLSIRQLREPERAGSWLNKIAVWVAGQHRRQRARRTRLRELSPEHTHPVHCEQPSLEARRSVHAFYHLLDRLPAHERMAFTLRYIDGMTLPAAADACQTSLATFKRRLARAQQRFRRAAQEWPGIEEWIELGTRFAATKPLRRGAAGHG